MFKALRLCAGAALALCPGIALAIPIAVTSCGTVIGAPGLYAVNDDLTASDAGTCITIASSGVTLKLGANVTGINSGVGISVREAGVVVRGSGTDHSTMPNISGFSIGVQDEAGGNVIGDFNINSNHIGLVLEGASTTQTIVDNLAVNSNARDGIRILAPAGVRGVILTANNNGGTGYLIGTGSKGSVLANVSAEANIGIGIDVQGSSNTVYDCTVKGGKYGVMVEQGATGNTVVNCGDDSTPASKFGAFDANGSCDQNLWYSTFFSGRLKPRCTGTATVGQPLSRCATIATSGVYYLRKDLVIKSQDCLTVRGSDVTLNFNGHGIQGSGGMGIGLHVLGRAKNFKLLSDEAGPIQNFAVGIEIDGDNAIVEGPGLRNNSDTGVFVDGGRNVLLGDLGINSNGNFGMHLRNASGLVAHNYGANSNGAYGVYVEHSNDNVFSNFEAGNAGANGIAALYIGCSPTGPSPTCADTPNHGNVVTHAAGALNTQYGWVIDTGSKWNVVANTNGSGNNVFDMYEGNANCGHNDWIFDVPGSSNAPGCLQ